jgi:hypothetical protein
MISVGQIANYILGKYIVIDKIAFYINEEYIFNHYYNIMMEMDNSSFDILISDKFKSQKYSELRRKLTNNSWSIKYISEIRFSYKYKIMLSHIYFGGDMLQEGTLVSRTIVICQMIINKVRRMIGCKDKLLINAQYTQKMLAIYNIRFMYGADAGGVKFGEFNYVYDIFFCHGPRDSEIIRNLFKIPVFEMGYPRYDDYFKKIKDELYCKTLSKKYFCNKNKKTILWICTVSEYFSTIETYYSIILGLTETYNVIVRPHPIEIDPQYDRYKKNVFSLVSSGNFILSDNAFQDMTELYLISDYVVCDYGGSIFSALYMDKKIILINHKNVFKDLGIFSSTSMEVRKYLPYLDENNVDTLIKCLSSNIFWQESKNKREIARKYYFGNSNGGSAPLVAKKLRALLETTQAVPAELG